MPELTAVENTLDLADLDRLTRELQPDCVQVALSNPKPEANCVALESDPERGSWWRDTRV